jgi:hypothetical protein
MIVDPAEQFGLFRSITSIWRIIHNKDVYPFVASQIYDVAVYNPARQQGGETHPVYAAGI